MAGGRRGGGKRALGLLCPPRGVPQASAKGRMSHPNHWSGLTSPRISPACLGALSHGQCVSWLYPFNAHTQAPSRAAPQVGVDGVAWGQRLHEAHARVLDGKRHVLRGAGKGRAEKLSAQPAKATVRPPAPGPAALTGSAPPQPPSHRDGSVPLRPGCSSGWPAAPLSGSPRG